MFRVRDNPFVEQSSHTELGETLNTNVAGFG